MSCWLMENTGLNMESTLADVQDFTAYISYLSIIYFSSSYLPAYLSVWIGDSHEKLLITAFWTELLFWEHW